MTRIDIDTSLGDAKDPWQYARKVFVWLLLIGASAMAFVGYSDFQKGLATPVDLWMLPPLTVVTLVTAVMVAMSHARMKQALLLNCALLVVYYELCVFQSVLSTDVASAYSLASSSQFFPGLYIGLFVLTGRYATRVSWLIYLLLAGQCVYGLWGAPLLPGAEIKHQIYWSILAAHPCCIIMLTFMNHLRGMVEEARQDSLRAKEHFLAVVSHEVRSPLQTIVSSLELVEKAPPGPMHDRALHRMRSAAGLLETQIRDLTAFTRLELLPDFRPEPVRLGHVAALVDQTHQEVVRNKGLTLSVRLSTPDVEVLVDEARLRQIIDNLVSNATKYTDTGQITVGLEIDHQQCLHVWVQDTGRGIPSARLAQVFEPFVRIKAHPQERIEGSGLGLAVVRQLVGLMRGRLSVGSEEAKGTTINVRLPLPVLPSHQAHGQGVAPPQTVLIVDDDPEILQSLADLLVQWGVQRVLMAGDRQSACEQLACEDIDMAIVDLQLPDDNGVDIARFVRRGKRCAQLPMVALSASAAAQVAFLPGDAFQAFLPKPVTRETLISTVSRVMR